MFLAAITAMGWQVGAKMINGNRHNNHIQPASKSDASLCFLRRLMLGVIQIYDKHRRST